VRARATGPEVLVRETMPYAAALFFFPGCDDLEPEGLG
jgi:hypothetical protein